MKLYRHYKNKLYRFIDTVKHSETLEDLVLYESLYDNPLGRIWVRPKVMFWETVTTGGQTRPRFAKVDLTILSHTEMTPSLCATLDDLGKRSFPEWREEWLTERLERFPSFLALIGSVDGQPVAFKIGYRESGDDFYSWLGAVLPEYQRVGIAADLMAFQHEWAARHGFQRIRTKCLNFNQAMLILNVRHGFRVMAVEATQSGLKLILEKSLQPARTGPC